MPWVHRLTSNGFDSTGEHEASLAHSIVKFAWQPWRSKQSSFLAWKWQEAIPRIGCEQPTDSAGKVRSGCTFLRFNARKIFTALNNHRHSDLLLPNTGVNLTRVQAPVRPQWIRYHAAAHEATAPEVPRRSIQRPTLGDVRSAQLGWACRFCHPWHSELGVLAPRSRSGTGLPLFADHQSEVSKAGRRQATDSGTGRVGIQTPAAGGLAQLIRPAELPQSWFRSG